MLDAKLDQRQGRRHLHAFRKPILTFAGLACGAFLVFSFLGLQAYERRPSTCAVCRAYKTDYHFLTFRWSEQEDSDLTPWYSAHVEPSHTHEWVPCSYCRRIGIPGLTSGYSCLIGSPLTGLSQSVQTSIYQHFEDPLEATRLFIRLGRRDSNDSQIWEALMDWVNADYPGTWDDWWQQHGAGSQ